MTRYVWDGKNVVLRLVDTDGDGTVAASEVDNRYLWGQAVDQVFADEQVDDVTAEGDVYWPLTDNLGTVRDLVVYDADGDNSHGDVVEHRTYDAFGNPAADSNEDVEYIFAFTGQEYDAETGLYYYDQRYYDPHTGRFLSEDPVAGDPLNLYRYAGNSPTNNTDPSGLDFISVEPVSDRSSKGAFWNVQKNGYFSNPTSGD